MEDLKVPTETNIRHWAIMCEDASRPAWVTTDKEANEDKALKIFYGELQAPLAGLLWHHYAIPVEPNEYLSDEFPLALVLDCQHGKGA